MTEIELKSVWIPRKSGYLPSVTVDGAKSPSVKPSELKEKIPDFANPDTPFAIFAVKLYTVRNNVAICHWVPAFLGFETNHL